MSKYIVREKTINDIIFNKLEQHQTVVIMEEFTLENGLKVYLPSSLNKIIYTKYYNKSINSARNVAITICEFLNFVKEIVDKEEHEMFIELKEKGLYGLNFYHLSYFLNHCIMIKNNSLDTIKQKEKRLFEFYDYLIQSGLLDKNVKFEYKMLSTPNGKTKVKISPFENIEYQVMYPSKYANKTIKLKNMEEHLYQLLIELSEKYTPDITFGIALQIMGGLRKGEVVNLLVDDLKFDKSKNRIDVNIRNRTKELFLDRNVDISSCGVKKPRNQVVFNIDGNLYEYLKNHLEYRTIVMNNKNTFTKALMIDENGQAMTGTTYEQRFVKLKKKFLQILKENSYSSYLSLKNTKWSTHICRGIFTNLCIEKGYAKNIRDLANLRGDRSDESSAAYWDTNRLGKEINNIMNEISDIKKNKTEELN